MATCKAKTASGQPCRMQALKGSHFCFAHDRTKARARAEARKHGGQARHTPHAGELAAVMGRPRTIPEAMTILDYVLAEMLAGDNSIQRGRELRCLALAYADILKIGEFEARLRALEDARAGTMPPAEARP